MKNSVLVIFLILAQTGFSSPKNISLESEIQEIHERWFREAFTLTRNCVGFSAPVSARAYAYLSITAYESSLEIFSNQHSFSRRLNDYTRTHFIHKKNKKNKEEKEKTPLWESLQPGCLVIRNRKNA